MVSAINKELALRKSELADEKITSIYFGGGTPSLLSETELRVLMEQMTTLFDVGANTEITLEANPDDLSRENLRAFRQAGVNRLSIGIQTFDDPRLKWINRAHTSKEACASLQMSIEAGFDNISADLIYALPPEDMGYWESDLNKVLAYDLAHISLYGLTIEDQTVFGKWARKGKLHEVPEEMAARQYQLAIDLLTTSGYEHYEVSNFAKPGLHSRHNSSYWDDQKYLGVGPGAHSYNGENRSYNISHNAKYLSSLAAGVLPGTREELTETNRINEYLFTHLRTRKGVSLIAFTQKFGRDFAQDRQSQIDTYLQSGLAILENGSFHLTSQGFMIADEISWRLFYDE